MKNFMVLGIVLSALVEPVLSAGSVKDPIPLSSSPRYARTLATIIEILERDHYQGLTLDDTLSVALLNRYLGALDSRRAVFLKEDIDRFRKYRHRLDDAMHTGQLEPVFEIFRVYVQRVKERIQGVDRILDGDLDLSSEEEFEVYDDQSWARSRQQRDARWRRRIKHEYAELSLSCRSDEDIVSILRTRYQQIQKRATDANADEVFRQFVNALLSTLDPHSGYFLPHKRRSREQQDVPFLEGIGVQLKRDEEFVAIKRVFAGGAADRSRRVRPGDRILGVGEGRVGTMVDVVSWTLPDVVELIRGPSGSSVRLQLSSFGSRPISHVRGITLTRDRIKLRELRAHKSLIDVSRGMRFGVIQIPRFYIDYAGFGRGAETYSSTQNDVERLIVKLKQEGVDGIILDLRGNKGGALRAATGLTGLFIETGPVVQVKNAVGSVQIFGDSDARVIYTGPLAVLVDRYSASASEIFAAAIQDYSRGIIVGDYTFGKGSVQETYDLNDLLAREQSTFGQLVTTTALYFRVTGESTQLKGVRPDVIIPTSVFAAAYSERSERSAIPWEAIAAVDYQPVPTTVRVTAEVLAHHRCRIANNPVFDFIQERTLMETINNTPDQISLQLEKRRRQAGASLAQVTNEQANYTELEFRIDNALVEETAEILSDAIVVNARAEGGSRD